MSDVEFELWLSLREARVMDHARSRTELLDDVVRRADGADVPRAALLARRMLAEAHRTDGRWDLVFDLFRRSLAEYDRQPWRYAPGDGVDLLRWYASLVESMAHFPDIGLDEIGDALRDVEERFRVAGMNLHDVHAAYRGIAAHRGDWAAEERAHLRWRATADVDEDERRLLLTGIDRLLARGRPGCALEAAAVLLDDPEVCGEPLVLARSLVLLPLARAGRDAEAALTYRRLVRGLAGEEASLEEHGRVIEFCALTGNEGAGVDWLGPLRDLESRRRPFATMEFATAVAVLAGRLVVVGRGESVLDLGPDHSVSFRDLAARMRATALDLAGWFDRRNGTTFQGDRVRARLVAEPVRDFLPLAPTSRPPLDFRPPPGLSDADLLDRAAWHDLRCEPEEARACLAEVSADLPSFLAARRVELQARFVQGDDTEELLRWAAETHARCGDRARHLLAFCWLGLWIANVGRPDEGIATVSRAVADLRLLGDDSACAWGEHWLAYVLVGRGHRAEAFEALRRGVHHAAADPLALGSLRCLEAAWLNDDDADARVVIGRARAAFDALVSAGAPEKAIEAVEQLRVAYERASAVDEFRSFVEDWLVALPSPMFDRLRGHLHHLRALSGVGSGVGGVADDLNEAIGQAALRDADTVEQWYRLANADHAEGRHEDAVDAGLRAANWLDHLRDTVDQGWSEWADQARFLVAESYRVLGDREAALREFRRLAAGDGVLAASAFVAGASLLDGS
ncbi:hypothetical protein GCM10022243_09520 [Saccharothrix violaceirubra]|uniref:Tetratricopeptide (TPR) repeat protein n=1 Tax=Saccharothrix violaceirubra TaxID=413306 RepID=A0A7W7T6Q1_9PSEU|nr:hypothetical protein [Saccharothrix violaceirubra]MBB4966210.1 tetratricopeptide (TPR) repeat protein [Saccharothrix violaceirubra]